MPHHLFLASPEPDLDEADVEVVAELAVDLHRAAVERARDAKAVRATLDTPTQWGASRARDRS